jgi:hypothetical protein
MKYKKKFVIELNKIKIINYKKSYSKINEVINNLDKYYEYFDEIENKYENQFGGVAKKSNKNNSKKPNKNESKISKCKKFLKSAKLTILYFKNIAEQYYNAYVQTNLYYNSVLAKLKMEKEQINDVTNKITNLDNSNNLNMEKLEMLESTIGLLEKLTSTNMNIKLDMESIINGQNINYKTDTIIDNKSVKSTNVIIPLKQIGGDGVNYNVDDTIVTELRENMEQLVEKSENTKKRIAWINEKTRELTKRIKDIVTNKMFAIKTKVHLILNEWEKKNYRVEEAPVQDFKAIKQELATMMETVAKNTQIEDQYLEYIDNLEKYSTYLQDFADTTTTTLDQFDDQGLQAKNTDNNSNININNSAKAIQQKLEKTAETLKISLLGGKETGLVAESGKETGSDKGVQLQQGGKIKTKYKLIGGGLSKTLEDLYDDRRNSDVNRINIIINQIKNEIDIKYIDDTNNTNAKIYGFRIIILSMLYTLSLAIKNFKQVWALMPKDTLEHNEETNNIVQRWVDILNIQRDSSFYKNLLDKNVLINGKNTIRETLKKLQFEIGPIQFELNSITESNFEDNYNLINNTINYVQYTTYYLYFNYSGIDLMTNPNTITLPQLDEYFNSIIKFNGATDFTTFELMYGKDKIPDSTVVVNAVVNTNKSQTSLANTVQNTFTSAINNLTNFFTTSTSQVGGSGLESGSGSGSGSGSVEISNFLTEKKTLNKIEISMYNTWMGDLINVIRKRKFTDKPLDNKMLKTGITREEINKIKGLLDKLVSLYIKIGVKFGESVKIPSDKPFSDSDKNRIIKDNKDKPDMTNTKLDELITKAKEDRDALINRNKKQNLDFVALKTFITQKEPVTQTSNPTVAKVGGGKDAYNPRIDVIIEGLKDCQKKLLPFINKKFYISDTIELNKDKTDFSPQEIDALVAIYGTLEVEIQTATNLYIKTLPLVVCTIEYAPQLYVDANKNCNFNLTFNPENEEVTYNTANAKEECIKEYPDITNLKHLKVKSHQAFFESNHKNSTQDLINDPLIGVKKLIKIEPIPTLTPYNISVGILFPLGPSGTGKSFRLDGSSTATEKDKIGVRQSIIASAIDSGCEVSICYGMCYGRTDDYFTKKDKFEELLLFFNIDEVTKIKEAAAGTAATGTGTAATGTGTAATGTATGTGTGTAAGTPAEGTPAASLFRKYYAYKTDDTQNYTSYNNYTDFCVNVIDKKLVEIDFDKIQNYVQKGDTYQFQEIKPRITGNFRDILDNPYIWKNINKDDTDGISGDPTGNSKLGKMFEQLLREEKQLGLVLPTRNNIESSRRHLLVINRFKLTSNSDGTPIYKYFLLMDMAGTEDVEKMKDFFNNNGIEPKNMANLIEKVNKITQEFPIDRDEGNKKIKFNSLYEIVEYNKRDNPIAKYIGLKQKGGKSLEELNTELKNNNNKYTHTSYLNKIINEGAYINHTIGMLLLLATFVSKSIQQLVKVDKDGKETDEFDNCLAVVKTAVGNSLTTIDNQNKDDSKKTLLLLHEISYENILQSNCIWFQVLLSFVYWNDDTKDSIQELLKSLSEDKKRDSIAPYLSVYSENSLMKGLNFTIAKAVQVKKDLDDHTNLDKEIELVIKFFTDTLNGFYKSNNPKGVIIYKDKVIIDLEGNNDRLDPTKAKEEEKTAAEKKLVELNKQKTSIEGKKTIYNDIITHSTKEVAATGFSSLLKSKDISINISNENKKKLLDMITELKPYVKVQKLLGIGDWDEFYIDQTFNANVDQYYYRIFEILNNAPGALNKKILEQTKLKDDAIAALNNMQNDIDIYNKVIEFDKNNLSNMQKFMKDIDIEKLEYKDGKLLLPNKLVPIIIPPTTPIDITELITNIYRLPNTIDITKDPNIIKKNRLKLQLTNIKLGRLITVILFLLQLATAQPIKYHDTEKVFSIVQDFFENTEVSLKPPKDESEEKK